MFQTGDVAEWDRLTREVGLGSGAGLVSVRSAADNG